MKKYVLSAAVVTDFGTWQYDPTTPLKAAEFLEDDNYTSAIGYAETAGVLSELVGVDIAVNRILVNLEPGDQALVIRPKGGHRFSPDDKGNLSPEFLTEHVELGILKRL
jgi:hypothetical protein